MLISLKRVKISRLLAKMLKIINFCTRVNYISRNISVCKVSLDEEKSHKRKVKETVELVTLVDQNDKILGLKSKTESEKLARKLNLTLERVQDPKYGKMYPAYKLFSTSDILQKEKKESTAKVLKKLPLNCRISDHDLSLKVNTVKKWLDKNCEVHIAILNSNDSPTLMKNVFSKIQDMLKDQYRILNVRNKETGIKFIVLPPKQTSKNAPVSKEKKEDNLKED